MKMTKKKRFSLRCGGADGWNRFWVAGVASEKRSSANSCCWFVEVEFCEKRSTPPNSLLVDASVCGEVASFFYS